MSRRLNLSSEDRAARRKEQIARAQAKYKAANREKLNAASRARREADLEGAAKRMREYRKANPEIIAAIEARRVRSPEARAAFNAYRREWAKNNPDRLSEYAHRRNGSKIARLPRGTIPAIGDRQKWKCAACRTCLKRSGYHKDHIIALSAGGSNEPVNIQLLCPPCNLKKGKKHPVEFMQSRGFLL